MAEQGMLDMLKQARAMQKQMGKIQKKVEKRDVAAECAGGGVQVVVTGKLRLKRILIDQAVLDTKDKRQVQDLVAEAVNAGLEKAQAMVNHEMGKIAAKMGLPGGEDFAGGDEEFDDGMDKLAPSEDGDDAKSGRLRRWLGR
jgi:DNA-binding YbaB/EbfC family protein